VHNYSNSAYQLHLREQENETIKQTLIVTGNGFDMQCGLKSSYYDFFSWCELNIKGFKDLKNARNSMFNSQGLIQGAFENNPNLTVWDLYFMYKSTLTNNKWCDIEFEINESIQSGFWNSIISDINYFQENGNWSYPDEDWFFAWMMNNRYYSNNNWMLLKSGLPTGMIKTVQVSNDDFYRKLLLELNKFEKRFSNYMEEELMRNTDYQMNQSHLINKLVKSTTNDYEYSILTFNYTPYNSEYKYINIHGDLKSLIFGISNNNNKNNLAHIFTKSYRRMEKELPILADFVSNKENTVIFYGVSFNNLDIDYYSMIIEQFGSDILYFCYSDYGETNRKSEHENAIKKLVEQLSIGDFYNLRERGKIRIIKIN